MPLRDASRVTIIATVADEPVARLQAMVDSMSSQDHTGPLDLAIAAPVSDHAALARITESWTRGSVTLLENPSGSRSCGLNAAARSARGDYAVRVDARSRPPADYVRRCVKRLESDPSIGIVGGRQVAVASPSSSAEAAGIQRALRNHWLLGHSPYRVPGADGPVDTVYLGAFRTRELIARGYDEGLHANEDFDLCRRFASAGSLVWLEAGLDIRYEPRDRIVDVFHQYRAFGDAKVAYWRLGGQPPRGRQRMAIGAGVGAVGVMALGMRWPVVPVVLAGGIAGAYLVTDQITDGRSPLSIRLRSIPAHVAIELGWLCGIAHGMTRRGVPRDATT